MFISAKYLVVNYGVDETIARFFVDREPPANNLYWHEKLLYLRPAAGYLFIPLIVDLLYKIGLDREELLSPPFVTAMEKVGHVSALEETGKISVAQAITDCVEVVKGCTNKKWLAHVTEYMEGSTENLFFKLATPFKSLHRGDVFLFSLSVLEFSESLFVTIIEKWFALISFLLLADDAEDIEIDRASGDLNAFLESGLRKEGVDRIAEVTVAALNQISEVNQTMAETLNRHYSKQLSIANSRNL